MKMLENRIMWLSNVVVIEAQLQHDVLEIKIDRD